MITGYRRHLFTPSAIEQMSEVIVESLEQIVTHPELTVKELVTEINARISSPEKAIAKPNSPEILLTRPLKNIPRSNSPSTNNGAVLLKQKRINSPTVIQNNSVARSSYPELQRLNQVKQGRPIFWFHGGLGGVESYRTIAASCLRPFHGINAQGAKCPRFLNANLP